MEFSNSDGNEEYSPIEDYAAIGDCRCLGLISKTGSLDWLCLPRFDSPALFGALIDRRQGGHFAVRPASPYHAKRTYIENTNVLQTEFSTDNGKIRLTDLMPVHSRQGYREELCAERYILRKVECTAGAVEVEAIYEPRPDFGRQPAKLRDRGRLGIRHQHRGRLLNLLSDFPLTLHPDRSGCYGRITLAKGQSRYFNLTFTERNLAVIPPLDRDYLQKWLDKTVFWWRQWAGQCSYQGPYRQEVIRSALVLKLLSYAPSGALIAAPTCSLPERIGGSRNWDYRYCWLRDAAMTIRALLSLGYGDEAESYMSWLLHTTRLSRPALQVLYSVYGETRLGEVILDTLDGYRSSKPVRVGNAAGKQLQLDVYGEVVQGAYEIARKKLTFDRATRAMLVGVGNLICRKWRQPDKGIWEIRSAPRQNTHSKVMCWVVLDRLVSLHEQGMLKIPFEKFRKERDAIRNTVEEQAYDPGRGSYGSVFGSGEVDISLLMLPLYDYIAANDHRMVGTCNRIRQSLEKNNLFYRFPFGFDGIEEGEGAFAIGGFLMAKVLVKQGVKAEARRVFEKSLSCANDVGLFGEEIDADTGAALGNFPQAYTHVGLINAAVALSAK